jgi:hypothetical protein
MLGAALNEAEENSTTPKVGEKKRRIVVSPLTGAEMPVGRAKGVPNRVTRTIREAVEAAAQPGACHKDGLAGWLIDRAKGSLGDRQIFAAMVNKAMPLQVHANVNGGIKLELGWLGSRNIGTVTPQTPEARTQVLDLQPETDGTYRIKHPDGGPASDGGAADGVTDATAHGQDDPAKPA